MEFELDELLELDKKQMEVQPSIIKAGPNETIESFSSLVYSAKSTVHNGEEAIYGEFNGIVLRVGRDSTPSSIIEDYKAQTELQSNKYMLNQNIASFRSESGTKHIFEGEQENETRDQYVKRMVDSRRELDSKQQNSYANVYGMTDDAHIITVSKGMTTEQVRDEIRFLKTSDQAKVVSSDVYRTQMGPDAKDKQEIIDLGKELDKLKAGDWNDLVTWLDKFQNYTSKVDSNFIKSVVKKIDEKGFIVEHVKGNKVSVDNMKELYIYVTWVCKNSLTKKGYIDPKIHEIYRDIQDASQVA